MNDKGKCEKVREEIAKIIHNDWSVAKTEWSKHLQGEKKIWLDTVDKILSYPDICIKSDDQCLELESPCDGCDNKNEDDYGLFCDIACGKNTNWLVRTEERKGMLKDGWIKQVKED